MGQDERNAGRGLPGIATVDLHVQEKLGGWHYGCSL